MLKGIIDRFEGEYVVIEIDGETRDYLRSLLPSNAKVGDVVLIDRSHIKIDIEETKLRETRIKNLMDEVWDD